MTKKFMSHLMGVSQTPPHSNLFSVFTRPSGETTTLYKWITCLSVNEENVPVNLRMALIFTDF